MEKILIVIIPLVLVVLFGLVLAIPVMLLWNWLMPDIFGLQEIGYWQAFGVYILANFLTREIEMSKTLQIFLMRAEKAEARDLGLL